MTDREAGEALAAPEPEPFHQVRWKRADYLRWDAWNRKRIAALHHFRAR